MKSILSALLLFIATQTGLCLVGAQTGWSPNHLNPVGWIEAEKWLSLFADGALMEGIDWPDASGNQIHRWRNRNPGADATYRKSVAKLNGRPGFDLGSIGTISTSYYLANPYTIFLLETGEGGTASTRTLQADSTNSLITLGLRADGFNVFVQTGVVSTATSGVPSMCVLSIGPGNISNYLLNGIDRTTLATIGSDWGYPILGPSPASSNEPGATTVGVFMFFNRVLTAAEKTQLQRHYGKKYNITVP